MIFQTLDDKSECVGIYANGQLHFDPASFPTDISITWKYAPYLEEKNIEFVSLYLEGRRLTDHVPEFLKEDWDDVSRQLQAFQRSLETAQVNTSENCFFDLVPERFLVEYCEVQNKITQHLLTTIPRPKRYNFYKHVSVLLSQISQRPVCIDKKKVSSYLADIKLKNQAQSLLRFDPHVKYKQFGTKTGRLTTSPQTFPILTLNKSFRSAILPTNDYFVELDFNGAEVRTLLGLLGKEQPSEDVHDFHLRNIFTSLSSREDSKVAFFAWLYGSKKTTNAATAEILEKFYEKDKLLEKHWVDNKITTPYGKEIENVSRHHALNYLVQSTAAELTLKQALKINYVLRQHSQSHVAFLVHDAIVLDMKKDDGHLLTVLEELMASTNFGTFGINVKKGTSLGSLRKIIRG